MIGKGRRTIAIHFCIQVVLTALTRVLFTYKHTTTGKLFATGILITGVANLARGAGLLRQFNRNRKPAS